MKKVLSIAVAAFVLSVGGAFAEPPVTAVAGDYPGVDNPGLEQLADAEMVGVMGAAWWSGACTAAFETTGEAFVFVGIYTGRGLMHAAGLAGPFLADAVCV